MNSTRTELEKLKIYIERTFKTQKVFAKAIGYSEYGVSKAIKAAKARNGRLSSQFIDTLKGKGISITVELSDAFIEKILNEEPEYFAPLTQAAEEPEPYGKEIEKVKAENKLLKEKLKKLRATTKTGK